MTKAKLNQYLSAILVAMLEAGDGVVGESTLYLGLGADLTLWNTLRAFLVGGGLITVDSGHGVRLTERGKGIAEKCAMADLIRNPSKGW